ncbi:hypothetical protein GA0061094_3891 [[Bacillus] enclensis]|uniref:Uncharacterized protein n=1 Tax=[Bacillus] enclensis TaxID=1402860 RepID=A0A1C4DIA4_9BACI|nr:hypothetical protein GA0061094_3891 [[Bacillus] enclensis]
MVFPVFLFIEKTARLRKLTVFLPYLMIVDP